MVLWQRRIPIAYHPGTKETCWSIVVVEPGGTNNVLLSRLCEKLGGNFWRINKISKIRVSFCKLRFSFNKLYCGGPEITSKEELFIRSRSLWPPLYYKYGGNRYYHSCRVIVSQESRLPLPRVYFCLFHFISSYYSFLEPYCKLT